MPAFDTDQLAIAKAAAPDWKRSTIDDSYEVFTRLEEPTGAEEDWRYVEWTMPFASLLPAIPGGGALPDGPFLGSLPAVSGRVLIVDGFLVTSASEHMKLTPFSETHADPLTERLVPIDHNKLAAAHGAFGTDGVIVDIPAGSVVGPPLVIEVQSVTAQTASFPHVVIRSAENSEASVVLVYRSAPDAQLLVVPEVDLLLGPGARLNSVSVQSLDHAAVGVIHQRVVLGRDSTVKMGDVGLGGSLARLDLQVNLEGDGSSSELVGLYFGEGDQTIDYRMVIDHIGKSTTSDVFLKGAVEDNAQSVFTGLLRIEKGAEKTSTFETNRNLVLSENAKAHSVPNLEILCDDVVCGHGSSVGPLEEESLYYLQSRGLSRARAERLLIRGFFTEVIDRLAVSGLAGPVSQEVFRRFVAAQGEGRVS